MFIRLMGEIRGFTENSHESLIDAWLHIKDLLRSCHGHSLGRGTIIQNFYHGLDEATQAILDARGIFLYKTRKEAHQLLEDRILLKLDWSKDIKAKPLQKSFLSRKDHTHHRSVMTNQWGNPKKKATMPMEDIEEEDIEETTTAYKLKNPYPQRLRKEKMEELYAKFIDLIKEVKINVPLVDVLTGMPNYGKFLKDLVSNKSKMEQIYAAFLNKECSTIVQNKLPPKLGDPGNFLIPCTLVNSIECLALADIGASINLMPYSLYTSLSENTLKPTRMNLIDEVTEEELDALLDNSEPFSSTSEKINKTSLDKEFEEFMAVNIEEIPKQEEEVEDNFE
ncbi:hypothetical protein Tco_1042361 [Tanacetum coccineum]|uniref:Reverse transcriptase domain-containing protein n=1 Tax=Tanacetum coccineum TaxID=301880 RepID=A0ABQ5GJ80_9ASTR